ncbi:MAG: type IV secretion system protein [Neisseria animaloris]|nr:type IV secretion system protein [Neisseria animaloris]
MSDPKPVNSKESVVESVNGMSGMLEQFFTDLEEKINKIFVNEVQKYYEQIADQVIPIMAAALFVWIVYQAYQFFFAKADIGKISKTLAKFVFILITVSEWGTVYKYLADPVINGIPELVGSMIDGDSSKVIYSFVRKLFDHVVAGWQQLSTDLGALAMAFPVAFVYLCVFILAVLIVVCYFLIFLQVKLMLVLLMIAAPVFLGFAVFESTQKFFHNWVALIVTQFFTLLFLSVSVLLMVTLLSNVYSGIFPEGVASLGAAAGTLGGEFIALIVMWQAPKIASNLSSNGFSISGENIGNMLSKGGDMLMRMKTGGMGGSRGAGNIRNNRSSASQHRLRSGGKDK